MQAVLIAGLFLSLLACLYLLIVPTGIYGTSPVGVTMDMARRKLEEKLTEGDKAARLAIVNRSAADIIKSGLFIGLGLGVLALLAGMKFIGLLAIPAAIAVALLGIYLAELGAQNDFKTWQARLFEGVPVMVNFVPAFLEVGSISPREAIALTLPFLPEPLKTEVWTALDRIKRTGRVREALDSLASRAKHPCIESICSRLTTAWDTRIKADIFDDLGDDLDDLREMAATRATTLKGGMFAMICVIGLVGAMLIFGYPGMQYMVKQMGGGFGF